MRWRIVLDRDPPVTTAVDAGQCYGDLHLHFNLIVWVVDEYWGLSENGSRDVSVAKGTIKKFGYKINVEMLLETTECIRTRKKELGDTVPEMQL